jgi:pimeloyl-ACP methyl ester carboxylesterase
MIRAIASPFGSLIVRLKLDRARLESMLRGSGHEASLAAARIPEAFMDWRLAVHNDTAAMRQERKLVHRVVGGSGWRPGITFDDAALGAIDAPVLLVYGTADPTGDVATWRAFGARLPNGSLEIIEGAGHMPWFDEPERVASAVAAFLASPAAADVTPLAAAYAGRSRSDGPT